MRLDSRSPEGRDADRAIGDLQTVRAVFDEMPVVCISWTGPDHHIAAMNAACQAFAGRSGVVGLPFRTVFPDLAGQQIFALLVRVYATGEAQTGHEWRLQLDRGGSAPEDAYLDFTVVPRRAARRDADGAEQRYQAARDVVAELQEAAAGRRPIPPHQSVGTG